MSAIPNPSPVQSVAKADERTGLPTTDDSERTTDFVSNDAGERLPQIAGYEIRKELGRGGMGVVYLARHRDLNRQVALKVLLHGSVADGPQAARFLAESEALAAVPHPGIVQVFDRGTYDGLPFFAMEFCPGGSLADRIKEAPLSPGDAARIVEMLARAVGFAHSRGILHRDLKPGNVLFANDSNPKITDFGLAKRLDQADDGSEPLTETGAIMGTPSYMAPEQAEGREAGPAADVYALGAILYRVLAGRPPFAGSNRAATLQMVIAADPVPPRKLDAAIPRDLETICLKCLHKSPAQRYATAAELGADLERFQRNQPILARPIGPLERSWKWIRRHPTRAGLIAAVTLLLLTATGAAFALAFQERKAAKDLKKFNDDLLGEKLQTARALRESQIGAARLALDSGQLLCEQGDVARGLVTITRGLEPASEAGAADLESAIRFNLAAWQHDLWQLREVHQGMTGVHVSVTKLSPDGRMLAVAYTNNAVELWSLGDRKVMERHSLAHDSAVVQLEFSDDGRRLLARTQIFVYIWDVAGRKAIGSPIRVRSVMATAAINPDGSSFVTAGDDNTVRVSYLHPPAGEIKVLRQSLPARVVKFRPDGQRLLTADGGELRSWNAKTGVAVAPTMKHGAMITAIAYSRDGKRLVCGTGLSPKYRSALVCLWNAENGQLQSEFPIAGTQVRDVAFTPDGSAYAALTAEGVVQLRRSDTGALLTSPAIETGEVDSIRFSPDGAYLLLGAKNGQARFWDVASGVDRGPILYHQSGVRSCEMTPNGNTLVTNDGAIRIWDRPSPTCRSRFAGQSAMVLALGFNTTARMS